MLDLGGAQAKISLDISDFMGNLGTAESAANRFDGALGGASGRIQKLSGEIDLVGKGMLGIGLGILGIGGFGIKAAAQFDQGMANIQAATGVTGADLDKLRQKALDVGKDTTFGATDATVAIEGLGLAGLSTEQIMGGALDSVVALAESSGIRDLGVATDYLTGAMNAFGISGNDSIRIVDALANGASFSSAEVSDLASGLAYVGTTANSLGIPLEDTIALLGLLNDQNIRGSSAGTSLNQALTSLLNPTDKAIEAFASLGLSTDWMKNADGSFKNMTDLITTLDLATKDLSTTDRGKYLDQIFGSEGGKAINALLNSQSDAAKEAGKSWQDYLNVMDKTGTAAEMAKARMNSFSGDMEAFKGTIETIGITIGSYFIPFMRMGTQALTGLLGGFLNLPPSIQKFVAMATGAVGVVSLLGGAFLLALPRILAVRDAWVALGGLKGVGGLFRSAASSIGLLSPPLLIAAAAILAFGIAYKTNFMGFRDLVQDVGERAVYFGKQWKGAFDAFQGNGDNPLIASIKATGVSINALAPLFPKWSKQLQTVGHSIFDFGAYLDDAFGNSAERMLVRFPKPLQGLIHGIGTLADTVGDFGRAYKRGGLSGVLKAMPKEIGDLGIAFRRTMSGVGDLLRASAPNVGIFSEALTSLGTVFDKVGEVGKDVGQVIRNVLEGDFVGAMAWAKEAWSDFTDVLSSGWDTIKNVGSSLGDIAISIGGWAFDQAVEIGPSLYTWIKDTAIPAIGDAAQDIGEVAVKIGSWLVTSARDLGGAVMLWVRDTAWPIAKGIVSDLGDVAVSIGSWLVSSTAEIGSSVGSWITGTAWPAVSSVATSIGNAAIAIGSWIVSSTVDIWSSVSTWVTGTAWPAVSSTAVDIGSVLVNIGSWLVRAGAGIADAITSTVSTAWGLISGLTFGDIAGVVVNIVEYIVKESPLADLGGAIDSAVSDAYAFIVNSGDVVELGTVDAKISGYDIDPNTGELTRAMDGAAEEAKPSAREQGFKFGFVSGSGLLAGINAGFQWVFGGGGGDGGGGGFGSLIQTVMTVSETIGGFFEGLALPFLMASTKIPSPLPGIKNMFMPLWTGFDTAATWISDQAQAKMDDIIGVLEGIEIPTPDLSGMFDSVIDGFQYWTGPDNPLNATLWPIFDGIKNGITTAITDPGALFPDDLSIPMPDVSSWFDGWTFPAAGELPFVADFFKLIDSIKQSFSSAGFDFSLPDFSIDWPSLDSLKPPQFVIDAATMNPLDFAKKYFFGGGGSDSSSSRSSRDLSQEQADQQEAYDKALRIKKQYDNLGASGDRGGGGSGGTDTPVGWIPFANKQLDDLSSRLKPMQANLAALGLTKASPVIDVNDKSALTKLNAMRALNGTVLATAVVSIAAKEAGSGVVAGAKSAAQNALAGVSGGTTTTNTTVLKAIDNASPVIATVMANITAFVVNSIGVMGGWTSGIGTMLSTVAGGFSGTLAPALATGGANFDTFASSASSAMDTMSSSVSSGMSAASAAISSESGTWSGIIDGAAGSMAAAGYNAGAAAGYGVVNGLLSALGAVQAAAAQIAATVASAMALSLLIKSPSKVTTKLGMFAGLGLAAGLDQSTRTVTASSASLAKAITGPLTGGAWDKITSSIGNIGTLTDKDGKLSDQFKDMIADLKNLVGGDRKNTRGLISELTEAQKRLADYTVDDKHPQSALDAANKLSQAITTLTTGGVYSVGKGITESYGLSDKFYGSKSPLPKKAPNQPTQGNQGRTVYVDNRQFFAVKSSEFAKLQSDAEKGAQVHAGVSGLGSTSQTSRIRGTGVL